MVAKSHTQCFTLSEKLICWTSIFFTFLRSSFSTFLFFLFGTSFQCMGLGKHVQAYLFSNFHIYFYNFVRQGKSWVMMCGLRISGENEIYYALNITSCLATKVQVSQNVGLRNHCFPKLFFNDIVLRCLKLLKIFMTY